MDPGCMMESQVLQTVLDLGREAGLSKRPNEGCQSLEGIIRVIKAGVEPAMD